MATKLETPPLRLGPDDAGRRVSSEEFRVAEFAEGFTYERVRGRLVVMPPAGPEHRHVSRPFRRRLGGFWDTHPDIVDDVDIEGWVATSPDDERIPDICVYLAGPSSDEVVPDRVPDLVFEFVSGDRRDQERDYIHKRAEYHAVGVKEYVVVDRFKRSALVLTWQSGDYVERTLTASDEYSTPLLPGLTVPMAEVFNEFEGR